MLSAAEITVEALALKLRSKDQFVLLDVREPAELERARIVDARTAPAPMSSLARLGLGGLPEMARSKDAEILVLCHSGVRSAQVAAWLASSGWTRAFTVSGGIKEYARKVDPSVGSY
ncbi:MAG TPA: rhodanese-like domain-containing protein [Anaerolineales bacterium]|nr:rhodanese-like domain-containing protein [Anaerolineales bacterium]